MNGTRAPRRSGSLPAPSNATRPFPASSKGHRLWGLWYLLGGLAVGFGWLWGNTVQLQTSEAWILQLSTGIQLAPHFAILLQVADFFQGHLSQSQVIADTWAWGNQFLILICSVGIEFPAHTPAAKKRSAWFGWGCALFILLNALADYSYSALAGVFQQLAFAGMCLMMSFFFGLLAIHLIISGLSKLFGR